MKKLFSKLLGGTLLIGLSMSLTSCDDILGEWSRPTPVTPTVNPDVTPEPDPMLAIPLTLEVTTVGTIVVENSKSGMQYSLNGGARTNVPNGGAINNSDLNVGDKVEFYGTASSYYNTNIKGGSAEVKVYGNIMSLVDKDNFATIYNTLPADNTFRSLFSDNNKLTDASGLLLPATTLTDYCYESMFYGCTSLTTAPKLPATTLADNCYEHMFDGCSSLTTAPKLPATELKDNCYSSMFAGCIALTETPKLPATTLKDYCYFSMFYGCTSLSSVTCLATTNLTATNCTFNWLEGVAASGTFTQASGISWTSGASGIPSGWSVQNYVAP